MTKEFIPYQQALALKELGFDEPCLAYWYNETPTNSQGQCLVYYKKPWDNQKIIRGIIRDYYYAPLYQQAFRWFREKYELHSYIHADYSWNISGGIWDLNGYKGSRYDWDSEAYLSYEEAEQACLDRLIEIVKTNDIK